MVKKMPKAKYRDLTDALDKLTKNIQLLQAKRLIARSTSSPVSTI